MTSMNLFESVESMPNSSPVITGSGWINKDEYGFSRDYAFSIRGVRYVINCWANMGYLTCGELTIPFHNFRFTGTWPHHFKNELQFMYNGKTCAILPLEEYEQALPGDEEKENDHGT